MTPHEFCEKCDIYGQMFLGGFESGLNPTDLDHSNPEFNQLIRKMFQLWKGFCNEFDLIQDKAIQLISYDS